MFDTSRQRLRTAPWRKVLKFTAWFIVGMTLLVGVPTAGVHYTDFATFASEVAFSAFLWLFLSLYGLATFTYIWAGSDIPQGWENTKRFVREFPQHWRNFWSGVGAVLMFLIRLPGMCLRGLVAACRFLASLPSRWRAVPSRDKRAAGLMSIGIAIIGGVGYMLWPTASHVVGWLPSWLVTHDHDTFMFTMIVDMFMSAMGTILGLTVLRLLVDLGIALFRRETR
jgi:hypothetical protein